MNKVKGNIKVNIVDLPGFGPTKKDTCEDLAILTGATVVNEELGDDLDLIDVETLGEAEYATTDDRYTVLTVDSDTEAIEERITQVSKSIKDEKNQYIKKKLQERLSMLSGSVGVIKVGADSKIELKEKKDRVEDAIYAVKAALKEGIVPGGGIALLNASQKIEPTGDVVDMVNAGIIDPVLVTKSALKNAVSVVTTIVSADCVISNARADESNQ